MRKCIGPLVVGLLLIVYGSAAADPITITSSTVNGSAGATASLAFTNVGAGGNLSNEKPTAVGQVDLGDVSAAVAASLVLDLATPNSIMATGYVSVEAESLRRELGTSANASASGQIVVSLTVPTAHHFTFEGSFTAGGDLSANPGGTECSIFTCSTELFYTSSYLVGGPDQDNPLVDVEREGDGQVVKTGRIDPGRYVFVSEFYSTITRLSSPLSSGALGRGSSSFDVRLTFQELEETAAPVPEPGSFLLIGTGLAGLWRFRRRSQRSNLA